MIKLLLPIILFATGCIDTWDSKWARINTPAGERGYAIACHEDIDCWRLAGQLCLHGYSRLDVSSSGGYSHAEPGDSMVLTRNGRARNLLIECN